MTRDDILNLYKRRYLDFFLKDKFKEPDMKYVKEALSLLQDKYVNFIYNIIIKNNTQFAASQRGGYYICAAEDNKGSGICASDFVKDEPSVLMHELGHCCDYGLIGNEDSYSLIHPLDDEKHTLKDILADELNSNHEVILDKIVKECTENVNKELGDNMYELYLESNKLIKEESTLRRKTGGTFGLVLVDPKFKNKPDFEENCKRYKEVFNRMVEIHSGKIVKDVENCKSFRSMCDKYLIVTDILGQEYNVLKGYGLDGHYATYYKKRPKVYVNEFFANMFRFEMIGDEIRLQAVKDTFPKSYEAFYNLLPYLINKYNR